MNGSNRPGPTRSAAPSPKAAAARHLAAALAFTLAELRRADPDAAEAERVRAVARLGGWLPIAAAPAAGVAPHDRVLAFFPAREAGGVRLPPIRREGRLRDIAASRWGATHVLPLPPDPGTTMERRGDDPDARKENTDAV